MNKKIILIFLMAMVPALTQAQSIDVTVGNTTYHTVDALLTAIQKASGQEQTDLTQAYYAEVYPNQSSVVSAANTDSATLNSSPFANLPANLQGTCTGSMANLADAQVCAAKAEAQGSALGYNIDCSVNPISVNNVTSSYYPSCTVNGSSGHSAYLLAGFDSNSTILGHINPMWNSLPGTLAQQNNTYSSSGLPINTSSQATYMSGQTSSLSGSTSYSQSVSRLISSALNTLNSAYQSVQTSGISNQSGTTGGASSGSTCSVTVNAPLLNVRQAPNRNGAVMGQLTGGSTFSAVGLVEGENVEGTSKWWQMSNGNYVWAGGTYSQSTSCGQGSGSGSGSGSSSGGSGSGTGSGTGAVPTSVIATGPVYARYIKVQSESRSWVAWNEIEIYDTNGNKLTPVGATASCTWCRWTSADPGVGPEKAIDGSAVTMWNAGETNPACNWFGVSAQDRAACGSGGQSAWIQIDLGSNANIGKIRLLTQNTPNPSQATHAIMVSQNVGSFFQAASFSGLVTAGTWLEVKVQ